MTDNPWTDPDAALARVEDQIRQAELAAVKARELASAVQAQVGKASSPGREVQAAVNAGGVLTELTLTEKALEWDERALARAIKDTINAAHRKVGEQAVALAAEAYGEGAPITERLRAEAEARSAQPDEPTIGYR